MPDFPHLRNAPIREAMIDIRVSLPPEVTVEALKGLHGAIKDDYPESKERRRWEGLIEMKDAGTRVESKALGVDGYVFRSADGKQVAQFRLDGFTFSRLRPYQTWEDLRNEAQRLWRIFAQGVKIAFVQRVAVRYIDVIELNIGDPLPKYLKKPPEPPERFLSTPGSSPELFQATASFLQRQLVYDPISEVHAYLTLALEAAPSGASKGQMILDSDVFKTFEVTPTEPEIWKLLEQLRVHKNQVFFGILTEEAWRQYQ